MARPRLRPRFEMVVPCTSRQALNHIDKHLKSPDAPCIGSILPPHVHLTVCESERHLWSPHLNVDVENHEDGALIRGLYGPHPDVWTLFAALYAILGFSGVIGLIFGLTQWSLGIPPVALWTVPLTLILATSVYGVALFGQHLGSDQMTQLRTFLDRSLQEPAPP